jgi:hypothetical protein
MPNQQISNWKFTLKRELSAAHSRWLLVFQTSHLENKSAKLNMS